MPSESLDSVLPTLTVQVRFPADWSLKDLQQHLGGIPLERIRLFPPPGCATEEDVLQVEAHEDRLCELEDGILVEKPMGWYESIIAILVATEIRKFISVHNLGKVLGPDGSLKILPGIVKIPDVSFISWNRWPRERLARRPIPTLIPDLVVEVLSETNTRAEMDGKLATYFQAGVRLVWYIDPDSKSAKTHTSTSHWVDVPPVGVLDGGDVLPGFQLSLAAVFQEADRQRPDSLESA